MQVVGQALEAAREQGDETGREKVSCVVCSLPVVARHTGDARCDGSKHNPWEISWEMSIGSTVVPEDC